MERTIVIDFNGLPGSGKTTICRDFERKYGKDLKICSHGNLFSKELQKFKLLASMKAILLGIPLLICYLRFMMKNSILSFQNVRMSMVFVVKFHKLQNITRHNWGIILVDQGVIQSLISLLYNKNIKDVVSANKVINRYCKLTKHQNIFCGTKLELEENLKRLHCRGEKKSRVYSSEESQLEILEVMSRNLSIMREQVRKNSYLQVRLDTSREVRDSSHILWNYLKESIYED